MAYHMLFCHYERFRMELLARVLNDTLLGSWHSRTFRVIEYQAVLDLVSGEQQG